MRSSSWPNSMPISQVLLVRPGRSARRGVLTVHSGDACAGERSALTYFNPWPEVPAGVRVMNTEEAIRRFIRWCHAVLSGEHPGAVRCPSMSDAVSTGISACSTDHRRASEPTGIHAQLVYTAVALSPVWNAEIPAGSGMGRVQDPALGTTERWTLCLA